MFRGLTTLGSAAILAFGLSVVPAAAGGANDVLKNYADVAQAGYEDSLETARTMQLAINQFLSSPTEPNLRAACAAWMPRLRPPVGWSAASRSPIRDPKIDWHPHVETMIRMKISSPCWPKTLC